MKAIKSSREVDEIFRGATRAACASLILLIRHTPDGRGPGGRVAFIAGKRLGKAVERNRSKRVMREAVRRSGGPWAGFDVVLIATPSTGSTEPADLDAALASALCRTGVSA